MKFFVMVSKGFSNHIKDNAVDLFLLSCTKLLNLESEMDAASHKVAANGGLHFKPGTLISRSDLCDS